MLKPFKIKDEHIGTAIVYMLANIYAEQVASNNILLEKFHQHNDLGIDETEKMFKKEVGKCTEEIIDLLYANYGELDLDDLKKDD